MVVRARVVRRRTVRVEVLEAVEQEGDVGGTMTKLELTEGMQPEEGGADGMGAVLLDRAPQSALAHRTECTSHRLEQ